MIRLCTPTFWETALATILACIGYFTPIKNIEHVMLMFFGIDIIYGYLASKKIAKKLGKKPMFSTKIIWEKTVPRATLSTVLLLGAYMIDKETHQEWIHFDSIIGWFICGLLLVSILENGYIVTEWRTIPLLDKMLKNKIEKQTGIKLDKIEDNDTE